MLSRFTISLLPLIPTNKMPMAITSTQSIFDIFRKHKTPVNGVLYPRHISASIHLWDRSQQEQFRYDIQKLADEEYIIIEQDVYRLTKKGYDYIYQHYSLQDTIDIILADIRRHRIGEDEMLLLQNLMLTLKNAERVHFDNYHEALRQIADRGWVTYNERGVVLTRDGYNEMYPD